MYNCVEQYFCYQKADYFEDSVAKQKIITSDDQR